MSRLFRILNDNETIGVVYDSKEHTSPRKKEDPFFCIPVKYIQKGKLGINSLILWKYTFFEYICPHNAANIFTISEIKKTHKTPLKEIAKAEEIRKAYFNSKK